ncbi:MAG TPA: hypothetical protein VMB71_06235 [Acetobacteraceae bacterium]|nr:hypothetical protein [Acetobacteraceae bacterium]
MATSSPHDWFLPRLRALVEQAAQAGIAPDVSVAVITNLINGPAFDAAPLETDENWNRDLGEPPKPPVIPDFDLGMPD